MGALHYGDHGYKIALDDRTLAHLQIVIVNKLRRGECFVFAWSTRDGGGAGRTTVWLSPSIPLRFEFAGGHPPTINRDWIELLSQTALGTSGMRILDEPEIATHAAVSM